MKTIRQAKWAYIICSVLLCLIGLTLIILPQTSARIISIAVGVISLLYGITKIVGYFSRDIYHLAFQFDLALGIFVTVFAVLMLFNSGALITFLPFMIGIFVLVDGVFKLQTAVDAWRFGLGEWWLILIGALLCIALAILLILNTKSSGIFLVTLIGIALLTDGIQNLFNALYTIKILRHSENAKTASNANAE